MIDWIDYKCKAWGPQHKEVLFGLREDGWPRRSVLGRIREEWEASGQRGRPTQVFAEVYRGDALQVQRGIREPFPMDYDLYSVMVVHYCIRGQAKAEQLEYLLERKIKHSEYFKVLDRAHHFLSARIRSSAGVYTNTAGNAMFSATVAEVSANPPIATSAR